MAKTRDAGEVEATTVRARTSDGKEGNKTEKTTEPKDDLTARQTRIRYLAGRAREKARKRREKRETGLSCLASTKPNARIFIRKARRYDTSTLRIECKFKGEKGRQTLSAAGDRPGGVIYDVRKAKENS